jgi:sulfopyruvate decarboxylase subunit alpha
MEGDGSTLAGLSTLATVANVAPRNLIKIVWDNEAWLGPGRQGQSHLGPMATATAGRTDLEAVALGAGIEKTTTVRDEASLRFALERAFTEDGPHCIIGKVDATGGTSTPVRYGVTESAIRFRRALIDKGWVDPSTSVTGLKEQRSGSAGSEAAVRSGSVELDAITARLEAALPSKPPRPHLANARLLYEAVLDAGIDLTVYLPDSANYLFQRFAADDPNMLSVSVTREDEGLGIAMGAFLGGKTAALIMEGAGVGLCYLALALGIQHRMAALLISSHSSGLGERMDYNASVRYVVDPLLRAMNIPHYTARNVSEAADMIRDGATTVRGQSFSVSIQLPARIQWE